MSDHFFRFRFHVAVVVAFATASIATAQDSKQKLRKWSDLHSKQTIRAYFGGIENGKVKLKTKNGESFSIAIERLSQANQRFVRATKRHPGVAKEMYGIRWEPMNELLTDGRIADAENKPVFMFRVLGELDGIM